MLFKIRLLAMYCKARSIALISAEKIDVPFGKRTLVVCPPLTKAAAALSSSFDPSVYIFV